MYLETLKIEVKNDWNYQIKNLINYENCPHCATQNQQKQQQNICSLFLCIARYYCDTPMHV